METDQDQSNENKQSYLFRAYYSKRVSHCHLGFGRNLKADRVGNLYWKKKGKGFGYVVFVILLAWVNCRWAN